LAEKIDIFPELLALLQKSLADTLPNKLAEGGYIRDGFDEQIDHLRHLVQHTNEMALRNGAQ
jgi:DNA mismatch repair protein MutS